LHYPRTTTTVAAAAPLSPLHRHHPHRHRPHRHAPSPPRPSRPISIAAAALSPPYPRLSCRVTPRTPQGGAHAPPLGPFYPHPYVPFVIMNDHLVHVYCLLVHTRGRAHPVQGAAVLHDPHPRFSGTGCTPTGARRGRKRKRFR
jgi:hypothetical protein